MEAEALTPASAFAFMMELGAIEIWGGSLGLLDQLMAHLGVGCGAGDGGRWLFST